MPNYIGAGSLYLALRRAGAHMARGSLMSSEAFLPPVLEQPSLHLLSRLPSDVPRWIVGLAGMPGSGKSTLAMRLAAEVNASAGPGVMVALGMDGFHLTKAELSRLPNPDEAFARRGAPWTFNARALRERLEALRSAAGRETLSWPDFQHDIGDPIEGAHIIPPTARLILVEGLYLLHQADDWEAVRRIFDERWYLDTPFDLSMGRLVRRHMAAWGLTRAAAESRVAANDRLNAEIVAASRAFADRRLLP